MHLKLDLKFFSYTFLFLMYIHTTKHDQYDQTFTLFCIINCEHKNPLLKVVVVVEAAVAVELAPSLLRAPVLPSLSAVGLKLQGIMLLYPHQVWDPVGVAAYRPHQPLYQVPLLLIQPLHNNIHSLFFFDSGG